MTMSALASDRRVLACIMVSMVWPIRPNSDRLTVRVSPMKPTLIGDHHVGAHGPHDVGRHVVHRAAVHQHHPVTLDRWKDAGQRHGRAHRAGERPLVEDDLLRGDEIDGDRAERRRQIVEAREAHVRAGDSRQQEIDLLPAVQGQRERKSALDPELDSRRVVTCVLLAAHVLVLERGESEHLVPIGLIEQLAEFVGGHAGGERAADEPAHAGAGDHVDREYGALRTSARHPRAPVRARCRRRTRRRHADAAGSTERRHRPTSSA